MQEYDYYPFGLAMKERSMSEDGYRFGFNGKENDRDFGNDQLIQDYGFRVYNPALGKFLSVDPLSPKYPFYTPFQFAGNKPTWALDIDGLEELPFSVHMLMHRDNPVLGVASFSFDWYNDRAASSVHAFGRGLEKVAMNLAPIRPVTPEEQQAIDEAGGELNHAIKSVSNLPFNLYTAGENYVETMSEGSVEEKIEQTTALVGTIAGMVKGKSPKTTGGGLFKQAGLVDDILNMKKSGNLTAFRAMLDKFDFGNYLENKLNVPKPTNMYRPHAHHIVMKVGNVWSSKSRAILEKFNIDPFFGKENLTWAPNAYKNHSKSTSKLIYEALEKSAKTGKRSEVLKTLQSFGEKMANGDFK